MALFIYSTAEKQIFIQGTETTLPYIYARTEFVCRADGKTIEATLIPFASERIFESGKPIFTTLEGGNIRIECQAGETQSLQTAELYLKAAYEELGYNVTIETL